jgi:hypothetical protein
MDSTAELQSLARSEGLWVADIGLHGLMGWHPCWRVADISDV